MPSNGKLDGQDKSPQSVSSNLSKSAASPSAMSPCITLVRFSAWMCAQAIWSVSTVQATSFPKSHAFGQISAQRILNLLPCHRPVLFATRLWSCPKTKRWRVVRADCFVPRSSRKRLSILSHVVRWISTA
ncbi:Uncharacterised protein [Streptococcus pneumoniae]|nr:Uncharacterised protein [Streptococcus pneumoniae]